MSSYEETSPDRKRKYKSKVVIKELNDTPDEEFRDRKRKKDNSKRKEEKLREKLKQKYRDHKFKNNEEDIPSKQTVDNIKQEKFSDYDGSSDESSNVVNNKNEKKVNSSKNNNKKYINETSDKNKEKIDQKKHKKHSESRNKSKVRDSFGSRDENHTDNHRRNAKYDDSQRSHSDNKFHNQKNRQDRRQEDHNHGRRKDHRREDRRHDHRHEDHPRRQWDQEPNNERGENGDNRNFEEKKKTESIKKEEPNFKLSGKLTEYTNTYNGIVIMYNEPTEARKPKTRWRFYPFKGEEALPMLQLHRQSAFLLGRDRKIADIPVDHPSCSKQHAVVQFRLVDYERPDGAIGRRVKPYVIDLESTNGTYVNNKRIDARRYVELLEKDVLKFGFSSREYVILHEKSKEDESESEDGGENDDASDANALKMKSKE